MITLLDENLNHIASLQDYEYFLWNRRYRGVDSFELHMNRHKKYADLLQIHRYIAYDDGETVRGGKIEYRELQLNEDGKISENWIIAGKSFSSVFDKRIAFHNTAIGDGYDDQTDEAESLMRHYVNVNIISPDDTDRQVELLELETDQERGDILSFRGRFQKISEILNSLSLASGLGWDVQLDLSTKKFKFVILEGASKTGIRFSPDYDTVRLVGFRQSRFEYESVIMVGGAGEGNARTVEVVERGDTV